jgi:hypothetical protein
MFCVQLEEKGRGRIGNPVVGGSIKIFYLKATQKRKSRSGDRIGKNGRLVLSSLSPSIVCFLRSKSDK